MQVRERWGDERPLPTACHRDVITPRARGNDGDAVALRVVLRRGEDHVAVEIDAKGQFIVGMVASRLRDVQHL